LVWGYSGGVNEERMERKQNSIWVRMISSRADDLILSVLDTLKRLSVIYTTAKSLSMGNIYTLTNLVVAFPEVDL